MPYYLHHDNIGSNVAISNAAGAVIERLAYEPFGKRRASDGASDPTNSIKGLNTDRGFTDHEHLDDLALVHMNGRVFDPLVGRFLSADPNVQFADDLQSYNRYSYVSNNPLNTSDPTGYFSLRSLFGDFEVAAAGFNSFSLKNDPLRRYATQYLGTHQWALTLVESIAAAATSFYCGGCGSAIIQADVTYAETGSITSGVKAGAISYAEAYALQQFAGPPAGNVTIPAFSSGLFFETVAHNFEEAEIQQLLAHVAKKNGVSLAEVDAVLFAVSELGDSVLGDRLDEPKADNHPGYVVIKGIFTRGPFPGASVLFDAADIALSMQGLPTGTSLAYYAKYAGIPIETHSLGSIDGSNIVAAGGTTQARLRAVPFPITVPLSPNVSVTNSLWDFVTGGIFGPLVNPSANFVRMAPGDHLLDSYRAYAPVNFNH